MTASQEHQEQLSRARRRYRLAKFELDRAMDELCRSFHPYMTAKVVVA